MFTGTADVVLTMHSRAIYIGTAGTLKVDMAGVDGQPGATGVIFAGCLAGTILPLVITKIYDTDTTASGVVLF